MSWTASPVIVGAAASAVPAVALAAAASPFVVVGAAITAPTAAVLVGFWLNRKLKVIHVLVNSRLDEALQKIERLEQALDLGPGEEP